MKNLSRRLERLEEKLWVKPGRRHMLVTNVDFTGDKSGEFLPWFVCARLGRAVEPRRARGAPREIPRQVGATANLARRKREMNTLRRWKQRVERLEQKTGIG